MTLHPARDVQTGLPALMDMLTYRRPAWSTSEEAFIDRFLHPLDGLAQDGFGNLWLSIPERDGSAPRILWSSHTDTVHRNAGRQSVVRRGPMALLRDAADGRKGRSNCLGADCTAGVWIMREMILARVPGLYIFHRDEESGGNGSGWIAANASEHLADVVFAIAFDRKGYGDVITHQGGRTASDAFACSVAAVLGGAYSPDDTGLFTDTAMYAALIGECSNVSVGYFGAHGPQEEQDVEFLLALRDTVVSADWSTLVAERSPGEISDDRWPPDWGWERSFDIDGRRPRCLAAYVEDHPGIAADFLEHLGVTVADLEDHAADFR